MKNNIKNILLFTFIMLFGSVMKAQQSYVHAIIVVNTGDKYDSPLSPNPVPAWTKSMNAIEDELNNVDAYTNLKIKKYYYTNANFNKTKLLRGLKNLKVNPNDVILFYFAGHGSGNDSREYPTLTVSRRKGTNGSIYNPTNSYKFGVPVSDIINTLKSKDARLTIGLYETCNGFIQKDLLNGGLKLQPSHRTRRNYKTLFEKTRGEVFIAAAEYGDGAGFDKEIGGYFTHWFLKELHFSIRNMELIPCDWYTIGINTIKKLKAFTLAKPDDFDEPQILMGEIGVFDKYGNKLNCNR